MKELTSADCR